ncbi:glycosyltransferase family 4 protein [Larkinella humicola]|uniref:Glycosyltransferase family 4 protein n=1 Tax=Larkinella humicola TaxID=2607654 RepID=A0A5N1JID7_9BACT|nr:glycosyltransferase family 1 protein [Larkinella humicola]KAA9355145.1 glycosyltransferase family 4 protein [Larkinella humicola]
MNVIIDASLPGIGFYHRQAKTGVSRVAEQLVKGLLASEQVQLSLAAPTNQAETLRYARETFGTQAPPLINRPVEQRWAKLENALLGPFAPQSMPSKVIRQVFYRSRKALKGEQARFSAERLPNGAIYHSPFFAIPDDIGRMPHVRKVLTVHDLIPIHHPEWFPAGERAVKEAIQNLPKDAHVVTVSEATKVDFCQFTGFDPTRVTPIHLAASKTLFYPVTDAARIKATQQRFGLGDEPYLLSLATLEPRKNLDHLIRCFVQLAESGELPTEVKLVLVGTKGWKMDQVLSEIAKNDKIRSRLVFTGFVPDEDLAAMYSGALAFVYPSLFEGFGLPPLEAMQCGLPVITSNVSSLPEVVGDAAIQVSPTDADALAQAMLTVVRSADLRNELATQALRRAQLFSWERFTSEHIRLYQTL